MSPTAGPPRTLTISAVLPPSSETGSTWVTLVVSCCKSPVLCNIFDTKARCSWLRLLGYIASALLGQVTRRTMQPKNCLKSPIKGLAVMYKVEEQWVYKDLQCSALAKWWAAALQTCNGVKCCSTAKYYQGRVMGHVIISYILSRGSMGYQAALTDIEGTCRCKSLHLISSRPGGSFNTGIWMLRQKHVICNSLIHTLQRAVLSACLHSSRFDK